MSCTKNRVSPKVPGSKSAHGLQDDFQTLLFLKHLKSLAPLGQGKDVGDQRPGVNLALAQEGQPSLPGGPLLAERARHLEFLVGDEAQVQLEGAAEQSYLGVLASATGDGQAQTGRCRDA